VKNCQELSRGSSIVKDSQIWSSMVKRWKDCGFRIGDFRIWIVDGGFWIERASREQSVRVKRNLKSTLEVKMLWKRRQKCTLS